MNDTTKQGIVHDLYILMTEDGERYVFWTQEKAEEFYENFYVNTLGYRGPYSIRGINFGESI